MRYRIYLVLYKENRKRKEIKKNTLTVLIIGKQSFCFVNQFFLTLIYAKIYNTIHTCFAHNTRFNLYNKRKPKNLLNSLNCRDHISVYSSKHIFVFCESTQLIDLLRKEDAKSDLLL